MRSQVRIPWYTKMAANRRREKERRREGGKERDKLGIEAEGNRSMTFHRAAATR